MKKIFIAFSFILLFVVKTFGQAAIDIPFTATDGTINMEIAVGLDLTATNCIDTHLGEYSLPPIPPTGGFMIIFDLQPYGCPQKSSFKDYRPPGNPPSFPFTGLVEHMLWWQVSSPGLPINITYNLPPGAIMSITDNITGTLLNLGPFTGQGVATIPGSYTALVTKALLKMQYGNIVPVELTSFTASILQNEKVVQLNWTTATETNNSGFEIERARLRSSNYAVASWETIGFVPGFGTTTEPKSYSFTDENISTGVYKYRLKQIDFDGSFEFSNEIEVQVDFTQKEFVLYQNYPNPFNPNTSLQYAIGSRQFVTLKVYDLLGREIVTLVNEEKQPGVYEVEFNASSLASGMYLYKLQAGSPKGQAFVQTKKMVLIK